MHVFSSAHDHLQWTDWVMRGVVGYLFLLFITKLLGQRSISQLHFLDFVTALLLGGLLGNPLSDPHLGMGDAMVTSTAIVVLHVLSSLLGLKWERWRVFLEPVPLPIIRNGRFLRKNLRRARISMDYVLSELRLQQVENIQEVAVALWEPGGQVSFFLHPEYEQPTRRDIHLNSGPFSLPVVVIKEGKVRQDALLSLGKDDAWLHGKLRGREIHSILLGMVSSREELQVFLYE
ncbi:DUF421 domain-containing protein [Ectobacillus ponti]|uniref:DUF421 domain-containing protein n=1 Tax=Ectobacillus ponti TaxID=2961894 RepID=A0AA41X654_9BACI|nr:YetF domain-containing protein [Ectobacillus ponti]MCP8967028.1 DUF421 domain-containing protein [Ectobacillus ponti]